MSRKATPSSQKALERTFMQRAIRLARRGTGLVSPNPLVGAVLVRNKTIIGEGWHRGPGRPHAEIEAFQNAQRRGHPLKGATLYVTLEPCSTQGRTPPCTDSIIREQLRRVVVGAIDPNPSHASRGIDLLRQAGIQTETGLLEEEATNLNPGFNHWIVQRTPLITLKSAMTLDGKIATASGQSKWITGPRARREVMNMRRQHDAILVGVETVLQDNPSLTDRTGPHLDQDHPKKKLRRIILDTRARTPVTAKVCQDAHAALTIIAVGKDAPADRVNRLRDHVAVWSLPTKQGRVSLKSLMKRLGQESITSVLVEGGGTVHGAFLDARLAHRVAFFYAPKILGGTDSRPAVGGSGWNRPEEFLRLTNIRWRKLSPDLLLTADIADKVNEPCLPESSKKQAP